MSDDVAEPVARVTLSAIYAVVMSTSTDVAEVKGALALIAVERKNDKTVLDDHETRLRALAAEQSEMVKKAELELVALAKRSEDFVTRASLWRVAGLAAGCSSALVGLLAWVVPHLN